MGETIHLSTDGTDVSAREVNHEMGLITAAAESGIGLGQQLGPGTQVLEVIATDAGVTALIEKPDGFCQIVSGEPDKMAGVIGAIVQLDDLKLP